MNLRRVPAQEDRHGCEGIGCMTIIPRGRRFCRFCIRFKIAPRPALAPLRR